jgi:hypothetical protein
MASALLAENQGQVFATVALPDDLSSDDIKCVVACVSSACYPPCERAFNASLFTYPLLHHTGTPSAPMEQCSTTRNMDVSTAKS